MENENKLVGKSFTVLSINMEHGNLEVCEKCGGKHTKDLFMKLDICNTGGQIVSLCRECSNKLEAIFCFVYPHRLSYLINLVKECFF